MPGNAEQDPPPGELASNGGSDLPGEASLILSEFRAMKNFSEIDGRAAAGILSSFFYRIGCFYLLVGLWFYSPSVEELAITFVGIQLLGTWAAYGLIQQPSGVE